MTKTTKEVFEVQTQNRDWEWGTQSTFDSVEQALEEANTLLECGQFVRINKVEVK